MNTKPIIHVGIAYDDSIKTISIASFSDQGEQKCHDDCEKQFPNQPHFVFQLFQEPVIFRRNLYTWLQKQNIPETNYNEFLASIVKGIREMFKESANDPDTN